MGVSDILTGLEQMLGKSNATDLISLYEGLGLVGQIGGIILGILLVLIIILTPIIVGLEVIYINFSILQEKIDALGEKNRVLGRTLQICLRDARLALVKANTIETGVTVNQVYLGLKIKSLIITVIIIGIILGPAQLMIVFILNNVINIVSVLTGLGG